MEGVHKNVHLQGIQSVDSYIWPIATQAKN